MSQEKFTPKAEDATLLTGDEVMEAIKAERRGEKLAPDLRVALKATLLASAERSRERWRKADRRDAGMFVAQMADLDRREAEAELQKGTLLTDQPDESVN